MREGGRVGRAGPGPVGDRRLLCAFFVAGRKLWKGCIAPCLSTGSRTAACLPLS